MSIFDRLVQLRQDLHRHPELSHKESGTQQRILNFLKAFPDGKLISLCAGKAMLICFDSRIPGPHRLFRADLDALPIQEAPGRGYASEAKGISHACGHDGHMAMVAALAHIWTNLPEKAGKLGLLFQHAEELGEGALEVCRDPDFLTWAPTQVFGFHNIPGAPLGHIIIGKDIFACASTGLRLLFKGESSHAAEPEKARSALRVIPKLLELAAELNSPVKDDRFFLATPVHVQIGHENFGITPGDGRLCFTLRSQLDSVLLQGLSALRHHAEELAAHEQLALKIEAVEPFPAVTIDADCTGLVETAARHAGLTVIKPAFPFLWSEDFGYFTQKYPGSYFGIGIGENRPGLHHPAYDFNDMVLEPAYKLFKELLKL